MAIIERRNRPVLRSKLLSEDALHVDFGLSGAAWHQPVGVGVDPM